jgi:hypothetical protein
MNFFSKIWNMGKIVEAGAGAEIFNMLELEPEQHKN